jgi:hypothetical protein
MKTQCFDREKIFGLVHHLLEPAEEALVRSHVFHCTDCLKVAQSFEKFDAVLSEWGEQSPSPWFDQKLKQALPARRPDSGFRLFWSLASTRAYAAAMLALFVVAGSFMIYHFHGTQPDVDSTPPVAKTQTAAPGQQQDQSPAAEIQTLAPDEEIKMAQNLSVLENLDMFEDFDVLSELPAGTNAGK